jgi:hypothetical protein
VACSLLEPEWTGDSTEQWTQYQDLSTPIVWRENLSKSWADAVSLLLKGQTPTMPMKEISNQASFCFCFVFVFSNTAQMVREKKEDNINYLHIIIYTVNSSQTRSHLRHWEIIDRADNSRDSAGVTITAFRI